jgi:hypothetical protein
MRGLPDFNFQAFHDASADLRKRGWKILSPAEHDEDTGFNPVTDTEENFDLQSAMRWDIAAVLKSDAVILLPGWRTSSGVAIELTVADAIGIPALEYPDLTTPENETVLQEAQRLVYGARQASYGHPADDFSRTGRMWGAILGIDDIAPHLVGLCMAAVKISREVNAHKDDNIVDLAGYAATVDLVHRRGQ